jgi:hypothetical protein
MKPSLVEVIVFLFELDEWGVLLVGSRYDDEIALLEMSLHIDDEVDELCLQRVDDFDDKNEVALDEGLDIQTTIVMFIILDNG